MDALKVISSIGGSGRPKIHVRCRETGQVWTLRDWAKHIAEVRGITTPVAAAAVARACKSGRRYLGLHWERVTNEQ